MLIFKDGLTIESSTGQVVAVGNPNNLPDSSGQTNTQPTNNQPNNQQSGNRTVLFSAYGQTIYNDAVKSLVTSPDGSGRQVIKWTNPDGSYVWADLTNDLVTQYSPENYKSADSSS